MLFRSKFGYKFNIIKGYQFHKKNIFSRFINDLYNLRLQYDKSDPMNQIAKLLQNSLYGKFGMKDEITKIDIFKYETEDDKDFVNTMIETSNISDMIELDNHILIISKNMNNFYYNEEKDIFHGSEINVGIASAITSYARIHMSYFKNNPLFKLYYTDTDSAVINIKLPDEMIGKELGLMKLEYIIKKAVFLAPKVYGLITDEANEIIKAKGLN